jgi:hypothetical protein
VWGNNSVTPLQRPKAWAGREVLTDAEVEQLKELSASVLEGDGDAVFGDALIEQALAGVKSAKSYDAGTGNYNHFWLVERDFDNRTSLITDPPDGRLPPMTPEAEKQRAAATEARKLHPADGPEDRALTERCISFGAPSLFAGYNSYYQIFQSPGHVVIAMEMIHDARIIPLDGRPHVSDSIRQWHGDSRGRWEGQTLVVETRNYSPKSGFMGSSADVRIVERFTRVSPNTLHYEITASDPKTWTKPWTVMIPLRRTDEKMYEYACHEGNLGMEGILAGHRAQEKEAARKGSR